MAGMTAGLRMSREQWEDVASASFVPLTISRVAPDFQGSISTRHAGETGITHVRSRSCEVVRGAKEIARAAPGHAAFMIQLSGLNHVEQVGRRDSVAPGQGLLYLTDEPYVLSFPGDADLLIVQGPAEHLGLTPTQLRGVVGRGMSLRTDSGLRAYTQVLRSSFGDDPLLSSSAETARVCVELLGGVLRRRLGAAAPPRSHEAVRAALQARVQAMLADVRLDVALLARAERVSVRTVHTVFAESGESPAAYIRARRLAKVERMLRETNLTIADIAASCGFADHAALTRAFGRERGMTPSAYRALGRRGA